MRYKALIALTGLTCTALAFGSMAPREALAENDPIYKVENGRVDQQTFNGYRRYGDACHRCHGPDGAGSSYAPSLTESLKLLSWEQFADVVINGRQNVNKTTNNVMPAFGLSEDVAMYMSDIYGYLKARSDEKLPRGRPKRLSDDG